MTEHLTVVEQRADAVVAYCPQHGAVSRFFPARQTGWNAAVTTARAHDDMVHGVYRSQTLYGVAVASESDQ